MLESENKLKDIHRVWEAASRRVIREVKAFLRDNPGHVIVLEDPRDMFYRIDHIVLDDSGVINFCRLNWGDTFLIQEHVVGFSFLRSLSEIFSMGKYELVKKTINLNVIDNG